MWENTVDVIANIPVWVPILFCFLVWLGLISAKEREAPKWIYVTFLSFPLIPMVQASSSSNLALAWSVFVVGMLLGATFGYRLQERWLLEDLGDAVRVSGEWVSMGVMMLIFFTQVISGIMSDMRPDLASLPAVIAIFGLIVSAGTGSFVGRALRVILASPLRAS